MLIKMEKELYNWIYDKEEHYWWHISRRRFLFKFLAEYFAPDKNVRILDFGCGTGLLTKELNKYWSAYGVDISPDAIKFCKARGLKNLKLIKNSNGIEFTKYPKSYFDVILALDVIEHIEDETQTLIEWHRILKKNGKLILTVPAYQFMWSYWDKMAHHKRRYTIKTLSRVLIGNNFNILRVTYFYSFLLPIAIVFRSIKTMLPCKDKGSDYVKLPKLLSKFFILISNLEISLIKYFRVPFGLSIICIAEKNKSLNNKFVSLFK